MDEQTPAAPPTTMSVAEAAERLGQTEHWYATQLRAGRLPGHKLGRKWRITEADLAEALELTARPATRPLQEVDSAGLTPRSRAHHERTSRGLPRIL
jgi:excisionase family DNA binding protein